MTELRFADINVKKAYGRLKKSEFQELFKQLPKFELQCLWQGKYLFPPQPSEQGELSQIGGSEKDRRKEGIAEV